MSERLFWLSFSNDTGNLGVVLTMATDMEEAVRRCAELGINPGGQVAGAPLVPPEDALPELHEQALATWNLPRDVLLTREDIEQGGVEVLSLREAEDILGEEVPLDVYDIEVTEA